MLLVTGATGTIGRPLIDLLTIEGAEVRAITRNPLAAGLPAGVEVVEGDPSRPDTIAPSLEGVTAPHRRGANDPRPPRAHLLRMDSRPRRRLPELTRRTGSNR